MADSMNKINDNGARKADEEISSVNSLKCLITEEFAKITSELKDFRKDVQNIDYRLMAIETKLNRFDNCKRT